MQLLRGCNFIPKQHLSTIKHWGLKHPANIEDFRFCDTWQLPNWHSIQLCNLLPGELNTVEPQNWGLTVARIGCDYASECAILIILFFLLCLSSHFSHCKTMVVVINPERDRTYERLFSVLACQSNHMQMPFVNSLYYESHYSLVHISYYFVRQKTQICIMVQEVVAAEDFQYFQYDCISIIIIIILPMAA